MTILDPLKLEWKSGFWIGYVFIRTQAEIFVYSVGDAFGDVFVIGVKPPSWEGSVKQITSDLRTSSSEDLSRTAEFFIKNSKGIGIFGTALLCVADTSQEHIKDILTKSFPDAIIAWANDLDN